MEKYINEVLENPKTINELKEWKELTKNMTLQEKIQLVLDKNKERLGK